jgi:hypothetical protein
MRHLNFLSIELIAPLASDETYVLGLSLSLGAVWLCTLTCAPHSGAATFYPLTTTGKLDVSYQPYRPLTRRIQPRFGFVGLFEERFSAKF